MVNSNFGLGKEYLLKVEHNSDLIQFITAFAEKENIRAASFTAIGALKRSKLGFYDQKNRKYVWFSLPFPQELASCIGNISIKNDRPFVHAHAVISDINGNTQAGHLLEGIVFAAEVYLKTLNIGRIERKDDAVTGLSLWDQKMG